MVDCLLRDQMLAPTLAPDSNLQLQRCGRGVAIVSAHGCNFATPCFQIYVRRIAIQLRLCSKRESALRKLDWHFRMASIVMEV